jgi:hypothetical protein
METLKMIWEILYAIFACIGMMVTFFTMLFIVWFCTTEIPLMKEDDDDPTFDNIKN